MIDSTLAEAYQRDRNVWNACAGVYETRIVSGHPDVVAYQAFEEDLLDRLLIYLMKDRDEPVHLLDVGCGSGRLHLRYGLRTATDAEMDRPSADLMRRARQASSGFEYDGNLAEGLHSVEGLDFSESMIELAKKKLIAAGLGSLIGSRLLFRKGSAFDLQPLAGEPLPVVASLCNSIGVMQGPSGAANLFKALRRAVEAAGGIAVISGYRKDSVGTFALGNYESTMEVCGQPVWLEPDTYAGPQFTRVPRKYKRARDPEQTICVNVLDGEGHIVKRDMVLRRNELAVKEVIRTGHIATHSDYESYWYSLEQFDEWISEHWPEGRSYHLAGKSLDSLRAEPAQIAILDMGGRLDGLLSRWRSP